MLFLLNLLSSNPRDLLLLVLSGGVNFFIVKQGVSALANVSQKFHIYQIDIYIYFLFFCSECMRSEKICKNQLVSAECVMLHVAQALCNPPFARITDCPPPQAATIEEDMKQV